MNYTTEQQQAIDALAREVFVTAGAGSGKTSLLVGRYLRAVLDDGCRPDDLPTVTFTKRAAAELRDRIRRGLVAAGRVDLAHRVDAAPIGTIHGLCTRLLRASPVEAGVDPGFTVLDRDQAEILLYDVWAEVWAERVATASPDELQVLGTEEAALTGGIIPLYSALRGFGESDPRFLVPTPAEPSELSRQTVAALDALRLQSRACRDGATTIANRDKLDACIEWLQTTPESEQVPADATCYFPHLNCGADAKPLFTEVALLLDRHRQALAQARLARLAGVADALLQQLDAAYTRRKAERGVLDFADLELRARALVAGGARPFGPDARLMVDEFQDTNRLQCALLDGLGVGTVLTVGDAYQSIYGFRGADVEVFRARDRALESRAAGETHRTGLQVNFRSRPSILAVLNHLFSRDDFFGADFPLLRAGRDADEPRRGRESVARGVLTPSVEVGVLDLGEVDLAQIGVDHWATLEARHVAERVQRLLCDEGWRPRDIVVLLRATTHFGAFEAALAACEVPSYVVGGRGYYAQDEVADVLALLQVLVNPCDDAALVTVLRSPMVGLSDDALVLLRTRGDGSPAARRGVGGRPGTRFLWEAVVRLAQANPGAAESDPARREAARPDAMPERDRQALVSLWQRLERLRRRYGRAGLAGVLEEALTAFDYDLAILRGGDGRRRFANIMKLLRLAEQYESVEGPDLAGLLAFLRRKGVVGDREGNAAVLAEDEDVVRVMTIHQAKGLEFPVVVVAGLGVGRRRRGSPTFLVDGQGRRAVRVRQSKAEGERGHFSLGPATAMVEEQERREREEEDRLYYVATTRAEERLVLVGTRVPPGRGGAADTDVLSRVLAVAGAEVPAVGDEVRPLEGLDLVLRGLSPLVPLPGPLASPRQLGSPPPAPSPVLLPSLAMASGRVSFSSLHAYAECPRRYYVERVLGLHLDTDGDEGRADAIDRIEGSARGPEGRAVGLVVHRVLQMLPLDQAPSADRVDALVQAACADLDVGAFASASSICRDLVLGFWRSPLATLPGLAAAEHEQTFAFAHDGVLVAGVMDAVVRGADEWQVIDYKTNRLGESAPADVAVAYLLQQQIYALACLLAGAPRVTMSLVFLERPQQPVSLTFAQDDVSRLRAALASALDGMAGGVFDERRGSWCGPCESEGLCRVVARSSGMV